MKRQILFCIDTLNDGGAEKVLIDILTHIEKKKYAVDLLVLRDYGVYFEKIPEHVNWFLLKDAGSYLSKKYDVEVAFLEGQATQFIALRKSKARKIAWVHIDLCSFHWSRCFFGDNAQEEWCYSRMDQIIFVSEQARDGFNRLFSCIATEQQVIHNLIDRRKIRELADADLPEKKKFTLCSVGRLVQQKAYHRLIPVLSRLYAEGYDFECWIIGEGPLRHALEKQIKDSGLQQIVFLLGFKENPYPYIKAADLFVQASFVEGFSLALCEAVCLEKPILATQVAGANEILQEGAAGLIVEQDFSSIYKGVKRLLENEAHRKTLSDKAAERAKFFNVDYTMREIHHLLD